MIQELSEKVWSNPAFQDAAARIELSLVTRELGVEGVSDIDLATVCRLMSAAAILACSEDQQHRRTAFRVATCAYELFGTGTLPLDQSLRVVLARLGNFPSFGTREPVDKAQVFLPLSLAAEEIASANGRQIEIDHQVYYLTDFQQQLWTSLMRSERVALAAPTSAGKSFVLEHYLSTCFTTDVPKSIAYIVPTRALIAQVAEDLTAQLKKFDGTKPEIVTVPVDGESKLPGRAIYVMTQERLQLMLGFHAEFSADVIVVDEAHSIADGSRGVLLQWVIDDLLNRNSGTQILFASPSIRNLDIFGRLFGLSDVRPFSSVEPTVSQNFLVVRIQSASKGRLTLHTAGDGSRPLTEIASLTLNQTIASRIDKLVHIPAAFGRNQSSIVYANGADEAEKIAIQLAELLGERETTAVQEALSELAKEAVHPNYVLAECVKRGVAFHYSNIPTQLRRAIEAAAVSGDITFLVCTSTLLQGVNLPAKNVFMHAPEKGRTRPLESTDFWNLSGRAGRLRREFQGNIFLIDYDKWKKKPLEGERDAVIVPAIESTVRQHEDQLVTVIRDEVTGRASDQSALETVFVRLYSDLKRGQLPSMMTRMGFADDSPELQTLSAALANAETKVTLPSEVVRRSPNISAHKQQRLFGKLQEAIDKGEASARALIPKHPRETDAFKSYADILEICHEIILGIDTAKNLHRFHALIAVKWMRGIALPQIVEDQIKRQTKQSTRTTIRKTLELIETEIRFQAVRLFGCYNTLLVHALDGAGMMELAASIPALPLYLEIGASDKTMISFISLGLSRVTAMKLNELSARKDLDAAGALQWLRTRPLDTLGLSPLLQAEVAAIANE